ncbi:MAG TPA: 3-hydroxyacyl-CoA dehydrogenase family protein [Spirochaetota bacterium]|nr:3-hydroxyacyl-CoA dehydrogenase family protein [Spirochaetota bacterium]HRZ27939.1 3-hydroxyacyl-CoA dehydrogenase family protein [Spirochaetota bacterium]HSA13572.1 3-hydroxyacyl-CoA dehydrogenase family protein [Spirochaetota bacterium]
MGIDKIKNIAVIGAGNMGHQIATLCALGGFRTTCTDVNGEVLKKAENFFNSYTVSRVEKGKLSADAARQAQANIRFVPDMKEAVKDADYVIEAVVELLDLKRKIFADLDRMAPKHAILATNSSRMVSSLIADATSRPEKVINLHFFNPALVMKLVEVVNGPHCAPETADVSFKLCEKLGKVPVMLNKEVEGFLLNRMLGALLREALWLHDMGVASFEDIDKACLYGAGHPMGPFRLMDLTGIDLEYTMRMEAFRRTGDRAQLPSPGVAERYFRGDYGEKTGRGWFDYSQKKK